jgi:hypothetical protein
MRRGAMLEIVPPFLGNYRCRHVAVTEHPLDDLQWGALQALTVNDNNFQVYPAESLAKE